MCDLRLQVSRVYKTGCMHYVCVSCVAIYIVKRVGLYRLSCMRVRVGATRRMLWVRAVRPREGIRVESVERGGYIRTRRVVRKQERVVEGFNRCQMGFRDLPCHADGEGSSRAQATERGTAGRERLIQHQTDTSLDVSETSVPCGRPLISDSIRSALLLMVGMEVVARCSLCSL